MFKKNKQQKGGESVKLSECDFGADYVVSKLQSIVYLAKDSASPENICSEITVENHDDDLSNAFNCSVAQRSSRQIVRVRISFPPVTSAVATVGRALNDSVTLDFSDDYLEEMERRGELSNIDHFQPYQYDLLRTFVFTALSSHTAALLTLGSDETGGLGPIVYFSTDDLMFHPQGSRDTTPKTTVLFKDVVSCIEEDPFPSKAGIRGGTQRLKGFISPQSQFNTADVEQVTLSDLNLLNCNGRTGGSLVFRVRACNTANRETTCDCWCLKCNTRLVLGGRDSGGVTTTKKRMTSSVNFYRRPLPKCADWSKIKMKDFGKVTARIDSDDDDDEDDGFFCGDGDEDDDGDDDIGNDNDNYNDNELLHPSASNTLLVCPNGCKRKYFDVLWESGCVIDDGTGQGIIYAHRDAALLLLRMSEQDARTIERAAFYSPDGRIAYDPRLPLSNEIKVSLKR